MAIWNVKKKKERRITFVRGICKQQSGEMALNAPKLFGDAAVIYCLKSNRAPGKRNRSAVFAKRIRVKCRRNGGSRESERLPGEGKTARITTLKRRVKELLEPALKRRKR